MADTAQHDQSVTYAACRACGAVNRLPWQRLAGGSPRCAKCKEALAVHDGVSDVNSLALASLIAHAPLPVVVDFWAEWCGPCKMFAPTFKRAAQEMAGRVVFAKVDTEHERAAANVHGIRSIPTLIVFKNGAEVARQSGAMPQSAFVQWLRGVAGP